MKLLLEIPMCSQLCVWTRGA